MALWHMQQSGEGGISSSPYSSSSLVVAFLKHVAEAVCYITLPPSSESSLHYRLWRWACSWNQSCKKPTNLLRNWFWIRSTGWEKLTWIWFALVREWSTTEDSSNFDSSFGGVDPRLLDCLPKCDLPCRNISPFPSLSLFRPSTAAPSLIICLSRRRRTLSFVLRGEWGEGEAIHSPYNSTKKVWQKSNKDSDSVVF